MHHDRNPAPLRAIESSSPDPDETERLEAVAMAEAADVLREQAAALPPDSNVRAIMLRSATRWAFASTFHEGFSFEVVR